MKPAKEYSILPQCERDGGYIIRPENDPVKKKSCVLISFVILAVLIIISGAFALVVGLFYSQEFTSTINTYWNKGHSSLSSSNKTSEAASQLPAGDIWNSTSRNPVIQNDTVIIVSPTTRQPESATKDNSSSGEDGTGDGQTFQTKSEDDVPGDEKTTEKPAAANSDGGMGDEDEEDESQEGDEETDDLTKPASHSATTKTPAATTTVAPTTTPAPTNTEHPTTRKPKHPTNHNSTKHGSGRQEDFAKAMQEMEKYVESVTGIRRAEFVIPILMLLVFVVALALSSCCCYLILKRKDKQRRKVLGKMITDLQAGDKGILLDQDVDE